MRDACDNADPLLERTAEQRHAHTGREGQWERAVQGVVINHSNAKTHAH